MSPVTSICVSFFSLSALCGPVRALAWAQFRGKVSDVGENARWSHHGYNVPPWLSLDASHGRRVYLTMMPTISWMPRGAWLPEPLTVLASLRFPRLKRATGSMLIEGLRVR